MLDTALKLVKALQLTEAQTALLQTDRKSTHKALKELSNIFLKHLNTATLSRVSEKSLTLQSQPSSRVTRNTIIKPAQKAASYHLTNQLELNEHKSEINSRMFIKR